MTRYLFRYCYECVNKATSERKCIVCGGHRPAPVGRMIFCELCPRAYHHDCYIPPMIKVKSKTAKGTAAAAAAAAAAAGNQATKADASIFLKQIPRGKWYCHNCHTKAPPRKRGPRKPKEPKEPKTAPNTSLNSSHDEAPPR
jgi:PHD-finger